MFSCTEWYKLEEYLQLDDADSFELNDTEPDKEGKAKQIMTNVYERNAKNRQACIKANGTECAVCGFDFGRTYGETMANKIHVHHITPLSEIGEEHIIDPVKDLVPICPNCHYVIHSKKNGVYTVDEVKAMIELNNKE